IDEWMKDAPQSDCTRYALGIEIICVRVTKSTILEIIRQKYEQMEEERTKALIAVERQRVVKKEPETLKKIAISDAEKSHYLITSYVYGNFTQLFKLQIPNMVFDQMLLGHYLEIVAKMPSKAIFSKSL
ncbi:Erlin-2, partial [Bienertia sinuspersici]